MPSPADPPPFLIDDHRLTMLTEGPQRLDALLALIDGADRSLRLLCYIYADDVAGRRVRDALLRACNRNVRVDMIVDGFGATAGTGFFDSLTAAGAGVCRYEPRPGRRYLLRNHQKLALADEARAIIGGFNVEDAYFGTAEDNAWRDLGLIVEGPAAGRLARYFDALLEWTHREKPRFRDLRAILKTHSRAGNGDRLRWLFGGPTRRLSPWALAVRSDMARARQMAMIAGYFAPNPGMLRRIEGIVRRGGEASVITAALSDNEATIAAARHCYRRLLRRGVAVSNISGASCTAKSM